MSSEQNTNLSFDRTILLPIVFGLLSLCGILMVFLVGRISSSMPTQPVVESATPFKYQFIGTEPGISTVVTEETGFPDGSVDGNGESPTFPMTDQPEPGIFERTPIPSRTPVVFATVTSISFFTNPSSANGSTQLPLTIGTYDDSHPLVTYNGWSSVTDNNAYQNTLHVSNIATSTVTFRFTGQQFTLKYQYAASFGTIRISIGGLNFDLDQSNENSEWTSAKLAQGTYTVTITHMSGGSVNIDSITITDTNTATPTATPTVTPTSLYQ